MREEARDAFDNVLWVGDLVAVSRSRGSGRRAHQVRHKVVKITVDESGGQEPLVTCRPVDDDLRPIMGRRCYGTRDRTKLALLAS